MFTPQEVSEKTFPKASGFNNGYGMAAVDEFLDALTEDYTALYKDNAALKAKLKVLAEKVEEYRATEDAMRSTLLSAQRMAARWSPTHRPSGTRCSRTPRRRPTGRWPIWSSRWRRPSTS